MSAQAAVQDLGEPEYEGHEQAGFTDRAKPPTSFYVAPGLYVKVWAASEKNKFPNAVIEQSYKDATGKQITNKVYIDNRALLALALNCQDAHREIARQQQQSWAQSR